jgi:hypothetical protein
MMTAVGGTPDVVVTVKEPAGVFEHVLFAELQSAVAVIVILFTPATVPA